MKKRWFFFLRKKVNRLFAGIFQSAKKGAGGIEFAAYRDYQPGDTIRSIAYSQSLKKNRYMVRDNIIEKGMICLFIIDRSASVFFGPSGIPKKEIQDKILNILAPAIAQNNNQVGFIIATDRVEQYFKPSFGEKSVMEKLDLISYHRPQSKLTDLDVSFRFIFQSNIQADLIFIISDFYSSMPFENSLKMLSKKYDVIPIILKDPFETSAFPKIKGGMIQFKDLETGEFFWGDKPKKISNKKLFEQLGLDYAILRTDAGENEWVQKLRIIFEQRKRKRRMR